MISFWTPLRLIVLLAPWGLSHAMAQVSPPPCSSAITDLRVRRDSGTGELAFRWSELSCELRLERNPDVAFPQAGTVVLHDPLVQGQALMPLKDMPPSTEFLAYRISTLDEDWKFWEACRRSSLQSGVFTELRNDDDSIGLSGSGLVAGDVEAALFIPPAPMELTRLLIYFVDSGASWPVVIHLHGDLGNSAPDEAVDLVPPILLPTVVGNAWTEVDLRPYGLKIHPNDHFWVSYEHQGPEPYLGRDLGSGGTPHLRLKAGGTWTSWGTNQEYLVRVEGERFCEVDRPMFEDITAAVGLADQRAWKVGWGDVNGDRYDDLLLQGARLLLNINGFAFSDVTNSAGLSPFLGMGGFGILADVNNDGSPDLLRASGRELDLDGDGVPAAPPLDTDGDTVPDEYPNTLLLNNGAGVFAPAPASGLNTWDPSTSGAMADFDADGNLDVVIANYVWEWPFSLAAPDRLYMGAGDGTFTEVTESAGLGSLYGSSNRLAYGLSVSDYDDDADMDIFVGHYFFQPNALWQNQLDAGSLTFVDMGAETGLAQDAVGDGGLSYGSSWADFDRDGDQDLIVPEIAHPRDQPQSDRTALRVNAGPPSFTFTDEASARGIKYVEGGQESSWVDFDNDGDLDLYLTATYVFQIGRLYRQDPDGTFTDVTYESGIFHDETIGHAWADHDLDGDMDLLLTHWDSGGTVHLYDNLVGEAYPSLTVRLRGEGCTTPGGCNCSAVGAKVTLVAGGETQVLEVQAGRGHFVNQNSLVVEFGLGSASVIDALRVRWPCGEESVHTGAEPGAFVLVTEGVPGVVTE